MIQSIRGFKDILPPETRIWQNTIDTAISLFQDFGYSEIYIPVIEKTDLFTRSIGNATDIIEKEMYTFKDRKGKLITLRPEATASIVRSYIQHKMYVEPVTKLYTIGPMFRRERPQKGRYRQFYQINVEAFGIESYYIDVELIFILYTLLSRLSVGEMIIHINTLGCLCCRSLFESHLIDVISAKVSSLCNDCIKRKEYNPLRILDCKVSSCRSAISDVNPISKFLCYDCRKHFNKVLNMLQCLRVPFKVDKYLVRGLDYYSRTTFEVYHKVVETKIAIAGGGRYDGLVKFLGGPKIPAIGFAIGLDRLVEFINSTSSSVTQNPNLFIVVLGKIAMKVGFEWQMKLNKDGVGVLIGDFKKSLKSQMKQANRVKSHYVLILGEQELKKGEVIFRCMKTGSQINILIDNILSEIKNKIIKTERKMQELDIKPVKE